ncbi:MAG: hypothetical protein ACYC5O_09305 [Anaerolineae bacterium]
MTRPTALVLMFGHSGASDVRQLVHDARLAATEDLLERARATGWDRVIFCSDTPDALADDGPALERVTSRGGAFHFGRQLQRVVADCGLEEYGVLYVGGGLPFLSALTLESMRVSLAVAESAAVTNNVHSSDFAGWTPGGAIMRATAPETDNDLAWQLRRAGLEVAELPRSTETTFDIDTPTDLALLTLAAESDLGVPLGQHLGAVLSRAPFDLSALRRTMSVLRSFDETTLCYGRISHHAWAYFAQKAACQTRIISEERGMRASGRLARGEVRSLLGFLAERRGFAETFDILAQLAGAVILDTRVLMAHCRQWASTEDRFNSDIGRPEAIQDDWLRAMTEAAMSCAVPVLMGGHCLVSGGLYLLGDAVGPKDIPC